MNETATPWYKQLTPKEVILTVVFIAGFLGYDTSVTEPRFERGRQAIRDAQKQIEEMQRVIDELKKGQDKQLQAWGIK